MRKDRPPQGNAGKEAIAVATTVVGIDDPEGQHVATHTREAAGASTSAPRARVGGGVMATNVLKRVRDALAETREPDPKVVCGRLLMKLSPDEREEAALFGLVAMALVELDQEHLLAEELDRWRKHTLGGRRRCDP